MAKSHQKLRNWQCVRQAVSGQFKVGISSLDHASLSSLFSAGSRRGGTLSFASVTDTSWHISQVDGWVYLWISMTKTKKNNLLDATASTNRGRNRQRKTQRRRERDGKSIIWWKIHMNKNLLLGLNSLLGNLCINKIGKFGFVLVWPGILYLKSLFHILYFWKKVNKWQYFLG